jgi:hypothetical protein
METFEKINIIKEIVEGFFKENAQFTDNLDRVGKNTKEQQRFQNRNQSIYPN